MEKRKEEILFGQIWNISLTIDWWLFFYAFRLGFTFNFLQFLQLLNFYFHLLVFLISFIFYCTLFAVSEWHLKCQFNAGILHSPLTDLLKANFGSVEKNCSVQLFSFCFRFLILISCWYCHRNCLNSVNLDHSCVAFISICSLLNYFSVFHAVMLIIVFSFKIQNYVLSISGIATLFKTRVKSSWLLQWCTVCCVHDIPFCCGHFALCCVCIITKFRHVGLYSVNVSAIVS